MEVVVMVVIAAAIGYGLKRFSRWITEITLRNVKREADMQDADQTPWGVG